MTRPRRDGGRLIPAVVALVAVAGVSLRGGSRVPVASIATAASPATATGRVDAAPPDRGSTQAPATGGTGQALDDAAVAALRHRGLRVPIDNTDVERLKGMFAQPRGENPPHEAVDILAPRATPIHAVDDGTIAKLFTSQAGGLTIYQFDPDQRFAYYYAHLDRYPPDLADGQRVTRGQVIGFVGTTGNAPPDTPHLHFAIFELDADHRWWSGRAIDPYLVLK